MESIGFQDLHTTFPHMKMEKRGRWGRAQSASDAISMTLITEPPTAFTHQA
jgi:hypothetical protein